MKLPSVTLSTSNEPRRSRFESGRLALGCAVLAFLLVWKGTVGGEVFAAARLLPHFSPWREVVSPSTAIPWDVLLWDGVAQFYLWRDLSNRLLRSGELPLWNPYVLCGAPLLANSQSAPFYPLHLLTCWLPTPRLMGWLAWFHLFWAGFGMALFLRQNGLSRLSCLLGAGLWSFSAFFTCWLQLSSVPATLAWFPWLLRGVQKVFELGWRGMGAFGLAGGMMLLAGHLQFALYGWLLALAYALWLFFVGGTTQGQLNPPFRLSNLRFLLVLVVGLMAAFLLAAIELLPVFELSRWSHRATVATEEGYQAYLRNALPPLHLVTYFFPEAFGHPRVSLSQTPSIGSYWGYGHYAEFALYVGILTLLWGIYALLGTRSKPVWFWLSIWVVAMLFALGTGLNRLLYFYLPGFSATGSPARILCLAAFALAVLAAYGFDGFSRTPETRPFWLAFALLGLLTGLFLGLSFWLLPAGIPPSQLGTGIQRHLPRFVLFLFMSELLGWLFLARRVHPSLALSGLLLLGWLDPLIQAYGYNPTAPASALFPPVAVLVSPVKQRGERIAVLNSRWSLYAPPPATLPPNTAMAYQLYDVAGYDSLAPRHLKRFLDWLNGEESAPLENGNLFFVRRFDPRLRWLRVERMLVNNRWLPLPPEEGSGIYLGAAEYEPDEQRLWARLETAWRERRILLQGADAAEAVQRYGSGTASPPNATVQLTTYRATRVELEVENPTQQTLWLFLADTWYPGWRARVDQRVVPVLLANGAFRAIPVLPGKHRVVLVFAPDSFRLGGLCSLLGVICFLTAPILPKVVKPLMGALLSLVHPHLRVDVEQVVRR